MTEDDIVIPLPATHIPRIGMNRADRMLTVTVAEAGTGLYAQRVVAGQHVLSADEPESTGGKDIGPSPYEYVLAGLGACTSISLRMYIERHNWDVKGIVIGLAHEKVLAQDGKSSVDHFSRAIHVKGDLTGAQRLRPMEIAEKCPVSLTLRRAAVIESKLAELAAFAVTDSREHQQ
jgi:putative redox protein